jgi:hypothetical protein
MKFMLLIHHDEQSWSALTEAERRQVYLEYRQLIQELQTNGQYLAGEQLQTATTASTVRVREGKSMITDGPFAETREQIGGFFLIDVDDADAAAGIAARIPSARMGAIEIRPVA